MPHTINLLFHCCHRTFSAQINTSNQYLTVSGRQTDGWLLCLRLTSKNMRRLTETILELMLLQSFWFSLTRLVFLGRSEMWLHTLQWLYLDVSLWFNSGCVILERHQRLICFTPPPACPTAVTQLHYLHPPRSSVQTAFPVVWSLTEASVIDLLKKGGSQIKTARSEKSVLFLLSFTAKTTEHA